MAAAGVKPRMHSIGCIAPYCPGPGGMAIEIVVDLPAFFAIIDSMFTLNVS